MGALGTVVETISYTYDSTWKDKLTSYGGVTIQSDALGNVTSDGTWTYTWEGGRRLAGMSKSGTTVSFRYDENGQRIKKTVNGVTTEYTVQGKRVAHVKNDSLGQLHIYYDGNRPDMVLYNGATYRYVHSLQGDILGLQNGTGSFVVEYRYDAWGRQVGKTGSLANSLGTLNPFRYRGYVYDEETSLYYLRSRYYNPIWCRFISADSVLGQVSGLLQHNPFIYCGNNPVVYNDEEGLFWESIFDVVSLCLSIGEVVANPTNPWSWAGLAGDIIDLVPFVTGVGEGVKTIGLTLRITSKVDNTVDTIHIVRAVDFGEDAFEKIADLRHVDNYVVSDRGVGQIIHKGYRIPADSALDYMKEYSQHAGIRPDFYNDLDGIIYELKPMNQNSMVQGIRQLRKYNQKLGGGNKMYLELYF